MPSPLYRHTGTALLRSTVATLAEAPSLWPDPADVESCRRWLDQVWSERGVAEAIGQASPTLAGRIASVLSGRARPKQVRRAVLSTARYLLRFTGRPTPFGLFAGVAPAVIGAAARVRWGLGHRPVVRADTGWLAEVVEHLEGLPELLERLDVVVTNLAVRRGRWLEAPHGPDRVRLARTPALAAVRQAAASPIRFAELADKLAGDFGSGPAPAWGLLTQLVERGLLVTSLRAPFTVTDPLGYLVDQLHDASAATLPAVADMLAGLEDVRDRIAAHNRTPVGAGVRAGIGSAMRPLAATARSPLAVDVQLDCQVQVPAAVVAELEQAAGVLLRLAREPRGSAGWIAYHRAFCDRYGTGTLVPVTDAVDPDAGIGYPPTYPGSVRPDPVPVPTDRDRRLFGLAWQAAVDGSGELPLSDELIDRLAGEQRSSPRTWRSRPGSTHGPGRMWMRAGSSC